eukprot:gene27884-33672_t
MSSKQANGNRLGGRKSNSVPLFLEFQFHRSEHVVSQHDIPIEHHSLRDKKYPKHTRKAHYGANISKAEYILANYRYLMSPMAPASHACWFDPDVPPPWEQVWGLGCKDGGSLGKGWVCPICLDTGSSGSSGSWSCPVCGEGVCEVDLKPILSYHSEVDASSRDSTTTMAIGHVLELVKIRVPKNSLSPVLASSSSINSSSNYTAGSSGASVCQCFPPPVNPIPVIASSGQCKWGCAWGSSRVGYAEAEALPALYGGLLEDVEEARRLVYARYIQSPSQTHPNNATPTSPVVTSYKQAIARSASSSSPADTVNTKDYVGYDADDAVLLSLLCDIEQKICADREAMYRTLSSLPASVPGPLPSAQESYAEGYGVHGGWKFLAPFLLPFVRDLLQMPDHIKGSVLSISNHTVTAELRKKHRFLTHLPLHSEVQFVEIDLLPWRPLASPMSSADVYSSNVLPTGSTVLSDTANISTNTWEAYATERARRMGEREKERKKERKEDQKRRQADQREVQERIQRLQLQEKQREEQAREIILLAPPLRKDDGKEEAIAVKDVGLQGSKEDDTAIAEGGNKAKGGVAVSYSQIAQRVGHFHFPSLPSSAPTQKMPPAPPAKSQNTSDSSEWRRGMTPPPPPPPPSSSSTSQKPNEKSGASAGKKGKGVPLLSTASTRSYR